MSVNQPYWFGLNYSGKIDKDRLPRMFQMIEDVHQSFIHNSLMFAYIRENSY